MVGLIVVVVVVVAVVVVIIANVAPVGEDLSDADDVNEVGVGKLFFLRLVLVRVHAYSLLLLRASPPLRSVFH